MYQANHIASTARHFTGPTEASYYRARYYDPNTGRFLSEDPIGFGGGSGFYSYTKSNPLNFIDSVGLSPQDVKKIKATFQKTIDDMVRSKQRRPGTGRFQGRLNDLQSWFGPKKACGDQAETLKQALKQGSYDTPWHFKVARIDNYWGWGVIAYSDDPKDTDLLLNPWSGEIHSGPGVWNEVNEWDFNQP